MGGTSLNVGILRGGEVPMLDHGRVEDVEIAFPLPDLVPLGAGGGSIAWLDGDHLRVGPRSAGAKPGPACFGFGGEEPTLTDADVVLGILRPEAFLGGSMAIDVDAARRALARVAEPLGCDVQEAAWRVRCAVHVVAGERLARELCAREIDPAHATVLAFGGNGATHCCGIAQAAGLRDVIVLPFAPVFCAFGASTADVLHRYETRADEGDAEVLRALALRDMRGEGFDAEDVRIDVRRFEREGTEWLAVQAIGELPHVDLAQIGAAAYGVTAGAAAMPAGSVQVPWAGIGVAPTPIHRRDELEPGAVLPGPALVDSATTTCAVPPGWTLLIDEYGAQRLSFDDEANPA
jgi:N-methylhydantoinase A